MLLYGSAVRKCLFHDRIPVTVTEKLALLLVFWTGDLSSLLA